MAALIPFILVGLLAWLLYGVLWTDRARAARVIAAPEGEAAGLDPAELWPGVGILRPTAATIRLAIGGLVVAGVLGLGLIAGLFALDPGLLVVAVIAAGPLWLCWLAIRRAGEEVIATEYGLTRRRFRRTEYRSWEEVERVEFHDGKLVLMFGQGMMTLGRNLRGRGWLLAAARERIATLKTEEGASAPAIGPTTEAAMQAQAGKAPLTKPPKAAKQPPRRDVADVELEPDGAPDRGAPSSIAPAVAAGAAGAAAAAAASEINAEDIAASASEVPEDDDSRSSAWWGGGSDDSDSGGDGGDGGD